MKQFEFATSHSWSHLATRPNNNYMFYDIKGKVKKRHFLLILLMRYCRPVKIGSGKIEKSIFFRGLRYTVRRQTEYYLENGLTVGLTCANDFELI